MPLFTEEYTCHELRPVVLMVWKMASVIQINCALSWDSCIQLAHVTAGMMVEEGMIDASWRPSESSGSC